MRVGMTADRRIEKRKQVKKEMSRLFHTKKQTVEKWEVWHHWFVYLAYRENWDDYGNAKGQR